MHVMKRMTVFISVFFSLLLGTVYGETYKIDSVQYKIDGHTKVSALERAVRIDRTKIFKTEAELEQYISDIRVQLKSQRVFDYADVTELRSAADENGRITVSLVIEARDTRNFIMLPDPSYDSNSGFSLKLKTKNYDFLGTMQTFSGSLFYDPDTDTFDHVTDRRLGAEGSFNLPFNLFSHEAVWVNSADASWILNRNMMTYDIREGLDYYLVTAGSFKWGPFVSATTERDNADSAGERSSVFSFGQKASVEKITWTGNYRNGYMIQAGQSVDYNLPQSLFSISVSAESQFYTAFKYMGIATQQYAFYDSNGITLRNQGACVRGIRDRDIKTDMMAAFNFDFPVKLFSTDFTAVAGRLGYNRSWPGIFDFELQLSPFVDAAIGHNYTTGSYFNPKDGWYGCGFEILGFLRKWRSIQGRISMGFDAVQLLQKLSANDSISDRLFNTGWRTGPLYELNIGIGLFY